MEQRSVLAVWEKLPYLEWTSTI